MKPSLRILISAAAMALPLPAFAADYEPPIVVDQPVEEVPVEVGSGWYLRGDIGYNFGVDAQDNFDFRTFDPFTGHLRFGDVRFRFAGRRRHLERRLRLQLHGHDPRRFHGRRLPLQLRWRHVECGALLLRSGLARNGLPLGRRVPTRRCSASWSMATSILAPMSASRPYVGGGLGYTYVDWGPLSDSLFCIRPCLSRGTACQLRARRRPKLALHLCRDGRPCL